MGAAGEATEVTGEVKLAGSSTGGATELGVKAAGGGILVMAADAAGFAAVAVVEVAVVQAG